MIRIERVGLPPGMKAFARRENGTVYVYVSAGLPAGERLAAIREALRAAPDAGWRTGHHPVLLPALAGGAGLRRAPEGRWTYWALLTAAIAVAASVVAMTLLSGAVTPRAAAVPPAAQSPGTTATADEAVAAVTATVFGSVPESRARSVAEPIPVPGFPGAPPAAGVHPRASP